MALHVNPYNELVATRLLDFFAIATPRTRRLWGVGTVLMLRELRETADAVAHGTLSDATAHWLANTIKTQAGPDPGVGQARQGLMEVLTSKDPLRVGGHDYLRLVELTEIIDASYLSHWATALRQGMGVGDGELTARRVGAHLLDAGFSSNFLHRWWTRSIRGNAGATTSLADVVEEAHALVTGPSHPFRVLVAFATELPLKAPLPNGWLADGQVAAWLREHGFEVANLRQHGGIWLDLEARDTWAAVALAADTIDRLATRVAIGQGRRFEPLPHAWVEGYDKPFRLRLPRTVAVHSLDRQRRIFEATDATFVDDALELVRPLHDGPAPAAVAGGWAAVEALLTRPGDRDKVICANRLALLIAASFPRAELTRLACAHIKSVPGVRTEELRAAPSNRAKCELLMEALTADAALTFGDASDHAAIAQLRRILAAPFESLRSIQNDATEALRRLYRMRNLIVHGARTRGIAVGASLRSAAPLVGEGLDRIAHAWIVDEVEPRVLVARTHVRLDMVRGGAKVLMTRLLE